MSPLIYVLEPFGGSARRHNPALPHVYFDDLALTRGDGVFESVLIRGGTPCNLRRHLQRFARSASLTGVGEVNQDQWERSTIEAAEEWAGIYGDRDARCTWTLSAGRLSTGLATAWMVLSEIPEKVVTQRTEGVTAMTTPRGVGAVGELPKWFPTGAKTLSYAMNSAAQRHARSEGFDEVIFLGPEGEVLEGATSTVVIVNKHGKLRTPPAGGEVLEGTTVAAIAEQAQRDGWRFKARPLTVDDLVAADSVWLVSSTRVAARVTRLDECKLKPGPHSEKFADLVDRALTQA